jgi:plastocyanin
MRHFGIAALVIVGAVTMACGGSGGYGSSTPVSPTPAAGSSSDTVTINILGVNGKQSFSPNPADVAAGKTAVFVNKDTITHRVVLDDLSIDTGNIAPGASSAPMQVGGMNKAYHCSIHQNMVGSLNQAPTPDPPCTGYCDSAH